MAVRMPARTTKTGKSKSLRWRGPTSRRQLERKTANTLPSWVFVAPGRYGIAQAPTERWPLLSRLNTTTKLVTPHYQARFRILEFLLMTAGYAWHRANHVVNGPKASAVQTGWQFNAWGGDLDGFILILGNKIMPVARKNVRSWQEMWVL